MSTPVDKTVRQRLFAAGSTAWDEFCRHRGPFYHPFVPADYPLAHAALLQLTGAASSFLELGSGNGVITVLADLLGFEAVGIEIDPWLVDAAESLAEEFESAATFVEGSFVPAEFRDRLGTIDTTYIAEGPSAYAELDRDMDDFDLIYMFPWPDEEATCIEMIRTSAPAAMVLTFDGTEGYRLLRHGRWQSLT